MLTAKYAVKITNRKQIQYKIQRLANMQNITAKLCENLNKRLDVLLYIFIPCR